MTKYWDFYNHIFPDKIARRVTDSLCEEIGSTAYGTGTASWLIDEFKSCGIKACVALAVATSPSLVESINNWIPNYCLFLISVFDKHGRTLLDLDKV